MTRLVAALVALPSLLPAVAHAQLTGAAAQPAPLDALFGLRLSPQIDEHVPPPGQAAATFVRGERASGTANRDVSVVGRGELRRNTTVIKARRFHYDLDIDLADAYGSVRIIRNGNLFVGPEAHLRIQANEGYMVKPVYHFTLTGGSGSAERIDLIDNERSVVEQGTYTACQCASDPAWYVKARRFDIDSGAQHGVARDGVLYFQHVPLFASPYLSFPLSNQRQSGFLPPTVGLNSTTGFDVLLPYYFNIAPNRNLTVYPRLMTRRGVQLAGTYRYLSPTYSGALTLEYLPHDLVTKTNRYAIYLQHSQNLGHGFAAYVNYNRVSDDRYPQDLTADNLITTGNTYLFQQEAGLTYQNGPWSVLLREQRWQTLPPSTAPYSREPELNVNYERFDVGGFDFGANANYSRFRISTSDMPEGQRITFNPYLSYSIQTPSYFVTPKVQWHVASYDLSNKSGLPNTQPPSFTKSVPTASFDSGLVFERPVRLFGQDYIQTLEPRLYYVYTPYRNQNDAPLFDTADADFGLAEIYTPNTFVGNDRIADANRLTAGVTTRFIDAASGDERARFVVAQEYYFADQRVTLTPTQRAVQARHSDLLLGASVKMGGGFAAETAFQYNSNNNQMVRSTIGFAWSPATREVLNVAYRYNRANSTLDNQPINQMVTSVQWPLTRHLYGVARLNYDLKGNRLVDGVLGFQYDADCWAFSLAMQRYANGINISGSPTSGTRVLAQLQLKGFSTIDNGLTQAFRASVPGYTPLPPPPLPVSRFSDYE